MSDLIDRKERNMRPIDTLREKIDLWKKSTTDTSLMSVLHDVLQQIDVAIYEMDHQEAVSPWHRVEDEMPKEGQRVVAMDENEDMEVVTFDGDGFEDSYGFYFTDVIYWMPIEPPKEE